jgi:hypothetical protein
MKLESTIQTEIVVHFRNKYQRNKTGLIFSVPNEATRKDKSFFSTGLLKGVSDLIIVLPGRVCFIECKTEKGRQSPEQIEFEQTVTNLGFEYYLVRSKKDFESLF